MRRRHPLSKVPVVSHDGHHYQLVEQAIVLKGSRRFTSKESSVPPVEFIIVAKTDTPNLRMA